ncbi:unnamed protein product [Didymodactylos carnosus]|uniref:Fucosyltransferase n=1 Tax=Didymodactylos carnosus TaxID=1234261 RepID=A0A8S2GU53_9BILA|nr:unnamed protein product [Didymodactylos carnosus]CAF3561963.1 unnamed protein product [Didymodactylos carnosus]
MKNIQCMKGGKIFEKKNMNDKPDILCQSGVSLDLFGRNNGQFKSYPSILTNKMLVLDDKLWRDVLSQFRSYDSVWGFHFDGESIDYYPWASEYKKLRLFDVTMGYNRQLYDWITPGYLLHYVPNITNPSLRLSANNVMVMKKSVTAYKNNSEITAPVMWINGNCNAKSGRTEYMSEFMKHIDVDSWGACMRNKGDLPPDIIRIQGGKGDDFWNLNWIQAKMALSSNYLFTIAIENSLTYDYVTEKLWQPLVAGSVPIYLGARNIEDWLPCKNCIIDLRQFKTPKEAAEFVRKVATNKSLYQTYHRWRSQPVLKQFQNIINYFDYSRKYSMECIVCDMAHDINILGKNPYSNIRKILSSLNPFEWVW